MSRGKYLGNLTTTGCYLRPQESEASITNSYSYPATSLSTTSYPILNSKLHSAVLEMMEVGQLVSDTRTTAGRQQSLRSYYMKPSRVIYHFTVA